MSTPITTEQSCHPARASSHGPSRSFDRGIVGEGKQIGSQNTEGKDLQWHDRRLWYELSRDVAVYGMRHHKLHAMPRSTACTKDAHRHAHANLVMKRSEPDKNSTGGVAQISKPSPKTLASKTQVKITPAATQNLFLLNQLCPASRTALPS
jgi:hypothetical protein